MKKYPKFMTGNLIKEKAYKILMNEYKGLAVDIITKIQNAKMYGQKEDQLKAIDEIVNKTLDKYTNILQPEERRKIDMLEYLINDSREVE